MWPSRAEDQPGSFATGLLAREAGQPTGPRLRANGPSGVEARPEAATSGQNPEGSRIEDFGLALCSFGVLWSRLPPESPHKGDRQVGGGAGGGELPRRGGAAGFAGRPRGPRHLAGEHPGGARQGPGAGEEVARHARGGALEAEGSDRCAAREGARAPARAAKVGRGRADEAALGPGRVGELEADLGPGGGSSYSRASA